MDIPLSPEGFAQIADIIDRFKHAYPDVRAIHSSTLARAHILATSLAHEYGLKVEKSEELRSWDYGVLNGRPVAEVLDVLKTLSNGAGRDLSPADGESMNSFLRRLTGRVKDIINSAPEQGIVVICTHLQSVLMAIHWLKLGLPDDIASMPYEYKEDNELQPGDWIEVRREWVL